VIVDSRTASLSVRPLARQREKTPIRFEPQALPGGCISGNRTGLLAVTGDGGHHMTRNRRVCQVVIFFLAHHKPLGYTCLFIKDLGKMTGHRFALPRKVLFDGQKGAR